MAAPNPDSNTFTNQLGTLWSGHSCRVTWESGPIMLKVAAALDNDSASNIDLSATISGVERVNANSLYPDQFHWLPQEYCFNTADYRTKTIVPMFV
jgi:hypothetical protein